MPAKSLNIHRVEKPWGRSALWPGFADPLPEHGAIGEIWFQNCGDETPDLLVKYLFTSEKLSIQVHPDDIAARAAGYRSGKDEAWIILSAEPGAAIAMGVSAPISHVTLRAAALDGSIEELVRWVPVKQGDIFYSPAGTIHAIGAGITLVEVQQNSDITYRLHDYGRPRDLHLEAGICVADVNPLSPDLFASGYRSICGKAEYAREILTEGRKFILERWRGKKSAHIGLDRDQPGWFIPLYGSGHIDAAVWSAGQCWLLDGPSNFMADTESDIIFAYIQDRHIEDLLQPPSL